MRAAPPTPPAMAELAGEELEFFDGMIQRCIEEGASGKNINLRQEDISRVLLKAKEIFISQPSMLELASPIKILGDIHGCAPAQQPPARAPVAPATGLLSARLARQRPDSAANGSLPPLFAGRCSGPGCLRFAELVRARMTCSPYINIEPARARRSPKLNSRETCRSKIHSPSIIPSTAAPPSAAAAAP